MTDIAENTPAPAFDLATDGDGRVSLDGLKGKNVVLYFYP
ncbi:MAG TPA: peroxiredoxin, partial [Brevundimonas sp.]|nr:peroxiredoxin [Brevundimonas sp.]